MIGILVIRCKSSTNTVLLLAGALTVSSSAPAISESCRYLAERIRRSRARSAPEAKSRRRRNRVADADAGGTLQDRGLPLATAMAACIAGSAALVIVLIWLGPETRGRHFTAEG